MSEFSFECKVCDLGAGIRSVRNAESQRWTEVEASPTQTTTHWGLCPECRLDELKEEVTELEDWLSKRKPKPTKRRLANNQLDLLSASPTPFGNGVPENAVSNPQS